MLFLWYSNTETHLSILILILMCSAVITTYLNLALSNDHGKYSLWLSNISLLTCFVYFYFLPCVCYLFCRGQTLAVPTSRIKTWRGSWWPGERGRAVSSGAATSSTWPPENGRPWATCWMPGPALDWWLLRQEKQRICWLSILWLVRWQWELHVCSARTRIVIDFQWARQLAKRHPWQYSYFFFVKIAISSVSAGQSLRTVWLWSCGRSSCRET